MMQFETVLLFGASRNTGLALAELLSARGVGVTALIRSDAARERLERAGVRTVLGDALRPEDVALAFEQAPTGSAVVSTLGSVGPARGLLVDDTGNRSVIDCAIAAQTPRFVLVTAIGCGEMAPYRSAQAIAAFGAVVDAKSRAEERLRSSSLDWTVVRPGGLRDGEPTGRAILTQDPEVHGFIRRSDLAVLLERVLRDEKTCREALAAVDSAESQCVRPIIPFPLVQPHEQEGRRAFGR
jgi:nucleoside-diphosphate-sugar epimerase